MYREFVARYGYGGVGASEIWGICDEDLTISGCPNAISVNAEDRATYGLPCDILIIAMVGDGGWYALDLARCDENGEPPVIVWPEYEKEKLDSCEVDRVIVAADFGIFLLTLFEEALQHERENPSPLIHQHPFVQDGGSA